MRRVHPAWLAWFALVISAPATVGAAVWAHEALSDAGAVVAAGYAALHVVACLVGGILLGDGNVKLFLQPSKREQKLAAEVEALREALLADGKDGGR